MRNGLPFVLLCSALAGPARAYRPFDGTDAGVAERRSLEVEAGPVGYDVRGGSREISTPQLTVNWGFAEGWESVVEARHVYSLDPPPASPRDRIDEVEASLKAVLRPGSLQGEEGPSVAAEFGPLLPGVRGDPGTGASAALLVSHLRPWGSFHWNGAPLWTREQEPGVFSSVILEGPAGWAVRPVAEGFVVFERGEPPARSLLLGAVAAVRAAQVRDLPEVEVRAGLTWTVSLPPSLEKD